MSDSDEREALAEALWSDLADLWDGRVVGASWSEAAPDLRHTNYDILDRLLAAGWRRDGVDRAELHPAHGHEFKATSDGYDGYDNECQACGLEDEQHEAEQVATRAETFLTAVLALCERAEEARYRAEESINGSRPGPAQITTSEIRGLLDSPAAGHETGDQA